MESLNKFTGNKIKILREKNNMSQTDLANKLGLTRQSVSRYENGERKTNQDLLFELADIFNISIDDLFPDRNKKPAKITTIYNQLTPPRQQNVLKYAEKQLEEQERRDNSNNVSSIEEYKIKYNNSTENEKIPFTRIGTTGAGIGEELYDDIIEETVYFDRSEVDQQLLETADFCIYVNGDSMEPAIKRDTYAFVRKTNEIRDGLVSLVIYDGTVLIKKIELIDDAINLVSLNPKYETIKVEPHYQFKQIGKIVQ